MVSPLSLTLQEPLLISLHRVIELFFFFFFCFFFLFLYFLVGMPWWAGMFGDAGFLVAGCIEMVYHYQIKYWLGFFGSVLFALGGFGYLFSGVLCAFHEGLSLDMMRSCWLGDIIAAILFCINALVIFIPAFLPLVKHLLSRRDETKPLFLKDGEETQSCEEDVSVNDFT
jgi:hypothetical protein